MIQLILALVVVGVLLYFLEQLPIDATIRLAIRVIVILCVVVWLLGVFGVMDIPVPRVR